MKQRNSNIDIVKGIACIAVIIIHYNIPNRYRGVIIKTACRFAVPFFFFVSGYYLLTREGKLDRRSVMRKLRHIFSLLTTASAFYFIYTVLFNMKYARSWNVKAYTLKLMTKGKIVKFFVSNDPFVYSHLWFLLALIYCYLLVLLFCFLSRKETCSAAYCLCLSLFLLIGYTCLGEFGKFFIPGSFPISGSDAKVMTCNIFIFRGFAPFLLGTAVRLYRDKLTSERIKPYEWLLLIAGLVISEIERYYTREAQMYIGTYLVLFVLIKFSLSNEKRTGIAARTLGYVGRNLSTDVYIYHIAVGKLIQQWTAPLKTRFAHETVFRLFQMGTVICTVLAVVFVFRWLKTAGRKNAEKGI